MSTIKANRYENTATTDGGLSIDSSGRIFAGGTIATPSTTSSDDIVIAGSGNVGITINSTNSAESAIFFADGTSGSSQYSGQVVYYHNVDALAFASAGSERFRVDASGRLLAGTSTSPTAGNGQYSNIVIQGYPGTPAGAGHISLQRGQAAFGANNQIGVINFGDNTGASYAGIECYADANSGTNDYPGRLVFSTSADGAASPSERMRINASGNTWINSSDFSTDYPGEGNTATGFFVESDGKVAISRTNTNPLVVNRNTSDGTLIDLRQAGTSEGTISVSGSTVSYNGGHLSRWSQLASGAARTEILRGSVLTNLDEMCEWGEEDNEQLNRMKGVLLT